MPPLLSSSDSSPVRAWLEPGDIVCGVRQEHVLHLNGLKEVDVPTKMEGAELEVLEALQPEASHNRTSYRVAIEAACHNRIANLT